MLWGTLLLGAALVEAPNEGVRAVVGRLAPGPDTSAWAWLNAVAVALALGVWLLAAALLVIARRRTAKDQS